MDLVHVVARVALGVVFVAAGASKVAAGRAWPAQAGQLGVPRIVAPAVPWFELAVGGATIAGVAGWVPTVIALATLAVFTGVLLRSLAQGRRPPCACFGAWSARPLGWGHVARNAGFSLVGVVALITS
ncbi:MAG: hypothetical protein HZB15_05015 [Actinobacteria bacterium]|nr:hypothetical protein [Actinomycetota bacterium]